MDKYTNPRKYFSLVGEKFGRLTVLSLMGSKQFKHSKQRMWLCKCDCGKEKILSTGNLKSRRTNSCGCLSGRPKLPDNLHAKHSCYNDYKQAARTRKYEFNLTLDEFLSIITQNCHYCGEIPLFVKKTKWTSFVRNGIDRKDNSKGYTLENSLPCCKNCNFGKNQLKYEEYIKYLDKLVEYRSKL